MTQQVRQLRKEVRVTTSRCMYLRILCLTTSKVQHRMCTTSPSASPADPQIETQKPTPTREELAAPFEKAEKSSPQFFELLSMDDAGLRTEIASGLESTDFKAHEETYFTLLKELNELGQYRYDEIAKSLTSLSKVQEIYEKFGTLNIIGSRAHLQYVEAVRNDPMRWLAK